MTTHDEQPDDSNDAVERLLHMAGPRELPSPIGRDAARLAVRTAWRQTVRARARRRWMLIAVPAAAVAAGVVLAVVTGWRPAPPAVADSVVARVVTATGAVRVRRGTSSAALAAGDAVHAGDLVETPTGVVAAFGLAGGGEIRQNGGTVLRWTGVRHVALDEGQIYLDSGQQVAAVVIATPAGVVRDIGTRFDVRVREGEVRVRIRDGAVRLESTAATRDIAAGHEVVVRRGASPEVRQTATFGDDWDWIVRASSFQLDGVTVSAFLKWVEAESGRPVEFRPPSLRGEMAATVLHGSVAGLSLDEVLDTVLPAVGLTHRLENGRIVMHRPAGGSRR